MTNLVNFIVGNEDDKITVDYTFEKTEKKLIITEAEVGNKKGDSTTNTITKIYPIDRVSVEVGVGKMKKAAKVLSAILIFLIGIGIAALSLVSDKICVGKLASMATVFPYVCYGVGGLLVVVGIIMFIAGLLRRKKKNLTTLIVKDEGDVVEKITFKDTPECEIATNLINLFKE